MKNARGSFIAIAALALFSGCASSGSDAEASGSDLSQAPAGAGAASADALVAKAITARKTFAPTIPLVLPPTLAVEGLFASVVNENGKVTSDTDVPGDGWRIEFTSTASCHQESCFVFEISGGTTVPSAVVAGDVPLGHGISGIYMPPGCHACAEGSVEWRFQGEHPGEDYFYSLKALSGKKTEQEMVALAKAAVERGPISPAGLLIAQAIAARPTFAPDVPVLFPPTLPVGGLFVTVQNENAKVATANLDVPGDGWRIDFTSQADCRKDTCFVWQIFGEHTVKAAATPGDLPLEDGISASYDAPGCSACAEGSIAWRMPALGTPAQDDTFTVKALTVARSEDAMVALAKTALRAGPQPITRR